MPLGTVGEQYSHQKWFAIPRRVVGINVLLNSEGQITLGSCRDDCAGGELVTAVMPTKVVATTNREPTQSGIRQDNIQQIRQVLVIAEL